MKLSKHEEKVRRLLIRVAKGDHASQRVGYISYKELWEQLSYEPWGQNRSRDVVQWITRVSGFELSNGRPPLNEIVVRTTRTEPVESWKSIKRYLKTEFGVVAPYESHMNAQEACWRYWTNHSPPRSEASTSSKEVGRADEFQAEEGYKQDQTVTFRSRNAKLVAKRKAFDDYTCQACAFRLEVNGRFVIDCHHTNPLGLLADVTVTRIEHLVCLCPTCHRIAHSERYPLSVADVRALVA